MLVFRAAKADDFDELVLVASWTTWATKIGPIAIKPRAATKAYVSIRIRIAGLLSYVFCATRENQSANDQARENQCTCK